MDGPQSTGNERRASGAEDSVSKVMTPENYERVTGFMMELSDAIDLTTAGLAMLRDLSPGDDRYAPALTLLGSGFERLLRCALASAWARDHGRLPDAAEFGTRGHCGHDILMMWKSLGGECGSAPPDLAAVLSMGVMPGTAQYRLLELLTDQAEPRGRYAQQRTYLGSGTNEVTPSVKLMTEAMIGLYRRGRLHAYLDRLEGAEDELYAARQDAVAGMERLAAAIAALFVGGELGTFAQEFSFLLAPLREP